MPTAPDKRNAFLDRCLFVDIEFDRGNRLRSLGAVCGKRSWQRSGVQKPRAVLEEVDRFGRDCGAAFVAGHNLLLEIRVLAMLQRRREHEQAAFRDRCQCDRWEVPWLEVVLQAEA